MTNSKLDVHIKRFIAGDKEQFEIIYNETKKYVYLSIYAIIKDQSLIEDLMQDTYMKVLDSLLTYKIGTSFTSFISTIARNLAINCYNKRKRVDLVEEYTVEENPNDTTLTSLALRVLTGLERDVVLYHIILNMKFKDISKILDKPIGNLYYAYKKALKIIKSNL